MKILNKCDIGVVNSFLRLYGDLLESRFGNVDIEIEILALPDSENHYDDLLVRLGNRIFISERLTGTIGMSEPEIFAAIAHEFGHILYRTHPWAPDAENRADTLAAELGLGSQMISVIEKIIASRRWRHLTSQHVQRIQYLSHLS